MFLEISKARIIDKKRVVEKGKKIYEKILPSLEKSYYGQYIVIEIESGDYLIDTDSSKARAKMQKQYPEAIFYAARIGNKAMFNFY